MLELILLPALTRFLGETAYLGSEATAVAAGDVRVAIAAVVVVVAAEEELVVTWPCFFLSILLRLKSDLLLRLRLLLEFLEEVAPLERRFMLLNFITCATSSTLFSSGENVCRFRA